MSDYLPSKILQYKARFFLYCFVLIYSCLSVGCGETGSKELAPGVPVTSFQVLKLDGSNVELKDLFGKVTVISLMASWCESCKGEFSELNELHHKLSSKGGLVLGIAMDDTIAALNEVKRQYKIDFPIVFDSQSKSRKIFKLTGFPETLVLDSKGAPKLLQDIGSNLTLKFIGPRPWNQALFEKQIMGLF